MWYASSCDSAVRGVAGLGAPSAAALSQLAAAFAALAAAAQEVLLLRRAFTARFDAARPCTLVVEMDLGQRQQRLRFRLAVDLAYEGLVSAARRGSAVAAAVQQPLPFAITWISGDFGRAADVSKAVGRGAAEWGAGAAADKGLLTAMIRAASKVGV